MSTYNNHKFTERGAIPLTGADGSPLELPLPSKLHHHHLPTISENYFYTIPALSTTNLSGPLLRPFDRVFKVPLQHSE